MRRTANRALPSGRLTPAEAAFFGGGLVLLGSGILLVGTNLPAALTAVTTFVLYVFVYTPLKPWTTLNTVIGAIPGALPPVIGWAAATGRIGVEAWALFLIVFLWQFPHFLAIAWIYREDYRRAGFKMLTGRDTEGASPAARPFLTRWCWYPWGSCPQRLAWLDRFILSAPCSGAPLRLGGHSVLAGRERPACPTLVANIVPLFACDSDSFVA